MNRFKDYEQLFARRAKGRNFKRLWQWFKLEQLDADTFVLMYETKRWLMDETIGAYKVIPNPLGEAARITRDNVVTLTYPHAVGDQTFHRVCERLLGLRIGSDKSGYKNYESHIRIYHRGYGKESTGYFPGIQFKLPTGVGERSTCLNPKPDVRKTLKVDVVQETKEQLSRLRKLVRGAIALGAMDDLLKVKMAHPWGMHNVLQAAGFDAMPNLDAVNIMDPSFDCAKQIIVLGLSKSSVPARYNAYGPDPIADDARMKELRLRVIENGMKAVRQRLYAQHEDAYHHVVVTK